ncbi:MAG: hypothetical protein GXP63_06750 [DPANN group archaeon]|nr:hypothetical protein [DPANN group archaeon]
MKQATIVAIVLGVLVLISAVQAVQLNSLRDSIKKESLVIDQAPAKQTSSSGTKRTTAVPSSIKDLPTMVGGC